MSEQKKVSIDEVILSRYKNKIGDLEGRLIESETYNEVLVKQNNRLVEELESLKPKEETEEGNDKQEVGE